MKLELNPFFQAFLAVLIIVGGTFLLFGPGPIQQTIDMGHNMTVGQGTLNSKIYVAVEGEAKVAIIDPVGLKVVGNIDLKLADQGMTLSFAPHNVQVSPDNKIVWVTANSGTHNHGLLNIPSAYAHGDETTVDMNVDQVIVIDPETDMIIKRIPIAKGLHLAHVVLTPDSKYAYITAQTEGAIYKVDGKTLEVIKEIKTGEASQPHGMRISPDGKYAYLAMLGSRALGIVDLSDDTFSETPLGGTAVQTGVTPDNKYVVVSLYDTKQLAIYNISSKKIERVNLPGTAKGPIQMYPTPDSRFIYLADQGYYFEQPLSEWVYKIDIKTKHVIKEIKTGKAPHGVVVSGDGKFVYVTNLLSNDVSVIDTAKDEEVGRIDVGKEPNGISIWYKK